MLNYHVNCEFIHTKQRFALYDVICMSYITTSILTKQIYLSFDLMYLKSSINVLLATKYQNIYQHIWKIFSKFKMENKFENGN